MYGLKPVPFKAEARLLQTEGWTLQPEAWGRCSPSAAGGVYWDKTVGIAFVDYGTGGAAIRRQRSTLIHFLLEICQQELPNG
jgi:hypothetical protein